VLIRITGAPFLYGRLSLPCQATATVFVIFVLAKSRKRDAARFGSIVLPTQAASRFLPVFCVFCYTFAKNLPDRLERKAGTKTHEAVETADDANRYNRIN
jgi:hypothetical protein